MDKSYFLLQGLVNKIAQRIHQSLKLEEVLATTVEEIREFLLSDRVLIYRIWDDGTVSQSWCWVYGHSNAMPLPFHPTYFFITLFIELEIKL